MEVDTVKLSRMVVEDDRDMKVSADPFGAGSLRDQLFGSERSAVAEGPVCLVRVSSCRRRTLFKSPTRR